MLADGAKAVGRVGEPVQQQDGAGRLTRADDEATVPVCRPDLRVAQAAAIEAIEQGQVLVIEVRAYARVELLEQSILQLEIGGDARDVIAALGREIRLEPQLVPDFQVGPAAQKPRIQTQTDDQKSEQNRSADRNEEFPHRAHASLIHRVFCGPIIAAIANLS